MLSNLQPKSQAAILRFDGLEWRGKQLKVQPIIDHPKKGRVRVPEKLVVYVSGYEKKTRPGETNNLRRISREETAAAAAQKRKIQMARKKKSAPRMTETEWRDMERAATRGFLTLARVRKGSQIKRTHLQWCEAREKPQIIHYKAFGGRTNVDRLLIELAPAYMHGIVSTADQLAQFKDEILSEAALLDIKFCSEMCKEGGVDDSMGDNDLCFPIDKSDATDWRSDSSLTVAVLEGERAKAKAMAKSLARLWDIPEKEKLMDGMDDEGRDRKRTKKGMRRKRGGGHRQAWR